MTANNGKLPIHQHISHASRLIYGGMHLGGGWNKNPISKDDESNTQALLEACIEHGINTLDLADIYTFGKAEEVVGRVLKKVPALVDNLIIQSKLGIKLTHDAKVKQYDLSASWAEKGLDAILKRLGIEKLDILFLHRPDPLMEIESLSNTLNRNYEQDKFDYLAVSNMHAGQMAYIQSNVGMPMVANQLEMSLLASDFVEDAITVNMSINSDIGFPRGTLEYCQPQGIQLQAWASMAQGLFDPQNINDDVPANVIATRQLVGELAESYNTCASAIVLAWLMRHPAMIQPVIGTTKPERIAEAAQASKILLSRDDWYHLLEARRGQEVP
ncbi:aldo/keto reductase [Agaribacter marinus]|uniref:Oxidoreductase n=1 Tax=Agaribacter marinus TaxID=1431249 RepID=A0AA37WJA6_9ALTE|nr:aldo/keto reductase [Agaribacter marinus]GLR71867.1 oxidoreductase [Agaribacter marinus]